MILHVISCFTVYKPKVIVIFKIFVYVGTHLSNSCNDKAALIRKDEYTNTNVFIQ